MDTDLTAIGKHCALPECRQLDFLPFKCLSCGDTHCLDHRSETSHRCRNEGAWATARRKAEVSTSSKPAFSSSNRLGAALPPINCASASCTTLVNTTRQPSVTCTRCRRQYCLKHRLQNDHDCASLPLPPDPRTLTAQASADKAKAALSKFRAWSSSKSSSLSSSFASLSPPRKPSSAAQRLAVIAKLKETAKGDVSIPQDKRIYLHVEAEAKSTTSKQPRGVVFFNKEWVLGKVLDKAAAQLGIANLNNKTDTDENRLRIFHIESGRLLDFNEKLEGAKVRDGDTIVLLRGMKVEDFRITEV